MRFFIAKCLLIYFYINGSFVYAQIPSGAIDFDRSVGFSVPRSIVVYPTLSGTDQVYLIPNGLQVASLAKGSQTFGLTHSGYSRDGSLVLRLIPTIDGVPVSDVIADLRTQFPSVKFSYPPVKNSKFSAAGPGFTEESRNSSIEPIASDLVRLINIPPLSVRALLSPRSYQIAIFAVSVEYIIRGASRDENGIAHLEDRTFRISTTVEGFCALNPSSALDASRSRFGCVSPMYKSKMVKEVQVLLRSKGYHKGVIDGLFGGETDASIRKFQKINQIPVDGIPSDELIEFLRPI